MVVPAMITSALDMQHTAPAEQIETTPNLRLREERDLLAAGVGMKVSNVPNLTGHRPP
jgi:hypothetical protein